MDGAVVGPGPAEQREGRCTASGTPESWPLGPRGLPGATAPVASNNPAPPSGTRVTDEPAVAVSHRQADAYPTPHAAPPPHAPPHLAAAARRNPPAPHAQ